MKVSIFGLGYVGTVCAGCLAKEGHEIVGVDPVRTKVDLINFGKSPIIEADIDEIIAEAVKTGRLRATDDSREAIRDTELSFVCVGTPSQINGNLDLTHVRHVCEQVGHALRDKPTRHTVVVRSTILPGSMRRVVIPVLEEHSGKKAGVDFGVCNNPEFLREGSAVTDFSFPSKTVIGEVDRASGDKVAALYAKLDAPLIRTEIETAEMIKYIDNSWHALKIGFANEIGNLCKSFGVDAHTAMEIFCLDKKLNISPAYLMPGFAFGGSCLPKDLRAINYRAKELDVELPVLGSILTSNRLQVERAVQMVTKTGKKKIGVLGFSFKAGTDDLRESPMVTLIETLIGKGYKLSLYDRDVSLARLFGANKEFIEREIPHISTLMRGSIDEVVGDAEVIVIGNKVEEFRDVQSELKAGQVLIDLVRLFDDVSNETYQGICW